MLYYKTMYLLSEKSNKLHTQRISASEYMGIQYMPYGYVTCNRDVLVKTKLEAGKTKDDLSLDICRK